MDGGRLCHFFLLQCIWKWGTFCILVSPMQHWRCASAHLEVVSFDLNVCNAWMYNWHIWMVIWISWVHLCIFKGIEGYLSWRGFGLNDLRLLSAIIHTWGYRGYLRVRGHDLRLFGCNCAYLKALRSFEFNWTIFNVVECNCAQLRVTRSFELEKNLIWGC